MGVNIILIISDVQKVFIRIRNFNPNFCLMAQKPAAAAAGVLRE
jgi:hypothetical protein